MNIVIDIRALMNGKLTGVEIYISNLLKEIAKIDKKNRYILYANAYSKNQVLNNLKKYCLPNKFEIVFTGIPNKILNFFLFFLKRPHLDKIIIRKVKDLKRIDLFFMPDLRPISLSKKIPLITTFHDLAFLKYPNYFSKRSLFFFKLINPKRLVSRSNKIIAVSEFTKKELIEVFPCSRKKISVIYEGPGSYIRTKIKKQDLIDFRKKYLLADDFILCLASINPRKNLKNIIKAFRLFKSQSDKKISLVIAGAINNKLFPKENIKEYKDIKYLGYISEKDKKYLYLLAKLFINLSFYEGFGLTVLEAFGYRTPVICSNSTALKEIAGDAALLVNPNDVFGLVNSINKAIDQENVKKLNLRALKRLREFSWKRCSEQTITLFSGFFDPYNPLEK